MIYFCIECDIRPQLKQSNKHSFNVDSMQQLMTYVIYFTLLKLTIMCIYIVDYAFAAES